MQKNLKGQFWSIDAMFAIFIFSIALIIVAFIWNTVNNQLATSFSSSATSMKLEAQTLAASFLSKGSPNNWYSLVNTTNPTTWTGIFIGVEKNTGRGVISENKLATFISMSNYNYQATKQALGINYEYYIEIIGNNLNISIGRNPLIYHSLSTYLTNETAIYNNEIVNVKIYIWSNTTLATE
ncbi:MAG: hypothetical protein ACP5UN_01195 [Candidatus Micrarchaeia archaeon]